MFDWLFIHKPEISADTPTFTPGTTPLPDAGDPFLNVLIAVFDDAVELCPNDWLDRQIRKVQGAIVAKWAVISPVLHAQFATMPDTLHALVDAALKALSVATVARPLVHAAVNIARGFVDAVWDDIFAKAQPKLAAMGVKLAA